MIVPQYWAEARLQHRARGKQVTVRRFGWSDSSMEDAQIHADTRVREAFDRVLAGEQLPRREHKRAYNGAEGLPIREEVIARDGDSVITRNSYGALCLNTPNALFVDIDFEGIHVRLDRWIKLLLFAPAIAGGFWSGRWGIGLSILVLGWVAARWIVKRIQKAKLKKEGGMEGRANRRIESFVESHPDWNLRQYRTPAGFRLLAMHRTFDPHEPEVEACFRALQTDPIYALMCVRQHCFRARVSPKPWRIGIAQHLRPRPGVWPIRPERMPERQRWVTEYERLAANFASCSYLRSLGGGGVDPAVERVRELHDRLAQAERALPLA